jgi:hypothetical protein
VRTQENVVNKFNTAQKPIQPEHAKSEAPQGKMYDSPADLAALVNDNVEAPAAEPVNIFDMPFADRFKVVEAEIASPDLMEPSMTDFPGESAEQVLKRAEIAYVHSVEHYNRAEGQQQTSMKGVVAARKLAGPKWKAAWVNKHAPRLGWDHANKLITLSAKSPEEQVAWLEKQAEAKRESDELRRPPAPRDGSVETSHVLALPDIVLTKAEKARIRKARQRAKEREARVEAGAPIPAEPLAPIEHRKALNTLKGRLAGYSYEMLKDVATMLDDYESQRVKKAA